MCIMSKAIQDNNLLYNLLSPLVQFGTRCHYHHFDVHGVENLPLDGAYIIAPCHQQALMEPLAVLCFTPKPPVFLARADIFAKPTLRAILTFLKIMPVYRIRDGQDKLGRNKVVFDRCRNVLLDGSPLCLMAEGRHNNRHHLLNMGKGMFRIAGETQTALGDYTLYIVPTGIDFDNYEQPYSNLVVNIGKPIPVQPFMEVYKCNEPVALNQMRDALFEALLPLMHDIRNEEHYEEIMTLCVVLNREMRCRKGLKNTAWNRFLMRQSISRQMDEMAKNNHEAHPLISTAANLAEQCRRVNIREEMVAEHWSFAATFVALIVVAAMVTAIVVVPVVRWIILFCLFCYPMAVIPTHLIVKNKIADPQFRSSVNWGVRFFGSIIYTIVIAIVLASTEGMWMNRIADIGAWWGLVAVAVVFICARVSASVTVFFRELVSNCHYWCLHLFRHSTVSETNKTYQTLTDLI